MSRDPEPWYNEGSGRLLWAAEEEDLEQVLGSLFGYHYLQLGDPAFSNCALSSLIPHRVFLSPADTTVGPCSLLRAKSTEIPLLNDSVDVVCLPHVLEQSEAPHQLLREVSRLLIPNGHIVLTGFNPLSVWSSGYMCARFLEAHKRKHKFISTLRIRDWLALLGFEVLETRCFYFRPLLHLPCFKQRLSYIEELGKRFLPFLGIAYRMVAIKRVGNVRSVRPNWKQSRKLWRVGSEGIARPT
jgi:SAM-dependent methyltransferase